MSEALKDAAFTVLGWGLTPLSLLLGLAARWLWRWAKTKRTVLRITARLFCSVVIVVASSSLVVGAFSLWVRYRPQPSAMEQNLAPGVVYRRFSRRAPRPIVVHIARIELAKVDLVPSSLATHGCLPAATTSAFVREQRVDLAINTQFFFPCPGLDHPESLTPGQPLRPVGAYAVDGEYIVRRPWFGNTIFIDPHGGVSLYDKPEAVHHAISGRHRLVAEGEAQSVDDGLLAPRLAVGFDRERTTMTIVLVDGRQRGYSEGLSLPEFAELLVELGVHEAIELDGGGSATMVAADEDGEPRVLNSPIHTRFPGRERPVANHLGVRVRD